MPGSRHPRPAVEPPADVDPHELAPEVRAQLRTLSKVAADRVARHLVAAGRLVDEDPAAALEQARAARALGARVAVVREAVGETAYAAGEWAEAIAELRAARRMTGDDSALPMIADAERALGRPDRALRTARSAEAAALAPAERAEMRIVEAGARRDLGQLDAALVTLQDTGLDRRSMRPWSARVWYAYADLLLAAGREDEAREWFVAAAGADPDGATDADERLLELDGVEVITEDDETTPAPQPTDPDRTDTSAPPDAVHHPDSVDPDAVDRDRVDPDRVDQAAVAVHPDSVDADVVDRDRVDPDHVDRAAVAVHPDSVDPDAVDRDRVDRDRVDRDRVDRDRVDREAVDREAVNRGAVGRDRVGRDRVNRGSVAAVDWEPEDRPHAADLADRTDLQDAADPDEADPVDAVEPRDPVDPGDPVDAVGTGDPVPLRFSDQGDQSGSSA